MNAWCSEEDHELSPRGAQVAGLASRQVLQTGAMSRWLEISSISGMPCARVEPESGRSQPLGGANVRAESALGQS